MKTSKSIQTNISTVEYPQGPEGIGFGQPVEERMKPKDGRAEKDDKDLGLFPERWFL